MSRVGKKPIPIPEKTKLTLTEGVLTVQGKNGSLTQAIHPDVVLEIGKEEVKLTPKKDDRKTRALQGTMRSIVDNMIAGVSKGFERVLEIHGIGYRAEAKCSNIIFSLGYSHPIDFALPKGVSVTIEKNNIVKLSGIDKQLIGQTAARIRQLRPPEPYKSKGVKYAEEYIQRKAGKSGTK
jgi:large subunit ribosomal protein L6